MSKQQTSSKVANTNDQFNLIEKNFLNLTLECKLEKKKAGQNERFLITENNKSKANDILNLRFQQLTIPLKTSSNSFPINSRMKSIIADVYKNDIYLSNAKTAINALETRKETTKTTKSSNAGSVSKMNSRVDRIENFIKSRVKQKLIPRLNYNLASGRKPTKIHDISKTTLTDFNLRKSSKISSIYILYL